MNVASDGRAIHHQLARQSSQPAGSKHLRCHKNRQLRRPQPNRGQDLIKQLRDAAGRFPKVKTGASPYDLKTFLSIDISVLVPFRFVLVPCPKFN